MGQLIPPVRRALPAGIGAGNVAMTAKANPAVHPAFKGQPDLFRWNTTPHHFSSDMVHHYFGPAGEHGIRIAAKGLEGLVQSNQRSASPCLAWRRDIESLKKRYLLLPSAALPGKNLRGRRAGTINYGKG